MTRPQRTALLRRLVAGRATLAPTDVAELLAGAADPLAVAPLAHRAWLDEALLVPLALLHERICRRVASALPAAIRDTPWSRWLDERVAEAALELLREDPRAWRVSPDEPTGFEQSVGSCFGIADRLAPDLIRAFHALESAERRRIHALLPHRLFGLPESARSRARSASSARDDARRSTLALRRLLAGLRALHEPER